MKPGDIMLVDWPQNGLHNQKVRIERIDSAVDIAHPDCPERMIVELAFISHPTLPKPVGIGLERLAGTPANARLREVEAADEGRQGELML